MPSIRFVPPKSLIRKAKRIARRKPGVAAASVGPPSSETMARTRSGWRAASRSAIDAATEWATTIASSSSRAARTAPMRSACAVSE